MNNVHENFQIVYLNNVCVLWIIEMINVDRVCYDNLL